MVVDKKGEKFKNLKKVITVEIIIISIKKKIGLKILSQRLICKCLLFNPKLTKHPKKKNRKRTRAVGAWGIDSEIPKKYGRQLISGKNKIKKYNPNFKLKIFERNTPIKNGAKAIWNSQKIGTYFM